MQYNLNSIINKYFYFYVIPNDAFDFNDNTHLTAKMMCDLP
jgi:hypothetical protein